MFGNLNLCALYLLLYHLILNELLEQVYYLSGLNCIGNTVILAKRQKPTMLPVMK